MKRIKVIKSVNMNKGKKMVAISYYGDDLPEDVRLELGEILHDRMKTSDIVMWHIRNEQEVKQCESFLNTIGNNVLSNDVAMRKCIEALINKYNLDLPNTSELEFTIHLWSDIVREKETGIYEITSACKRIAAITRDDMYKKYINPKFIKIVKRIIELNY